MTCTPFRYRDAADSAAAFAALLLGEALAPPLGAIADAAPLTLPERTARTVARIHETAAGFGAEARAVAAGGTCRETRDVARILADRGAPETLAPAMTARAFRYAEAAAVALAVTLDAGQPRRGRPETHGYGAPTFPEALAAMARDAVADAQRAAGMRGNPADAAEESRYGLVAAEALGEALGILAENPNRANAAREAFGAVIPDAIAAAFAARRTVRDYADRADRIADAAAVMLADAYRDAVPPMDAIARAGVWYVENPDRLGAPTGHGNPDAHAALWAVKNAAPVLSRHADGAAPSVAAYRHAVTATAADAILWPTGARHIAADALAVAAATVAEAYAERLARDAIAEALADQNAETLGAAIGPRRAMLADAGRRWNADAPGDGYAAAYARAVEILGSAQRVAETDGIPGAPGPAMLGAWAALLADHAEALALEAYGADAEALADAVAVMRAALETYADAARSHVTP